MTNAYDVVDFTDVHKDYGTIHDFDDLVDEVHDNGALAQLVGCGFDPGN